MLNKMYDEWRKDGGFADMAGKIIAEADKAKETPWGGVEDRVNTV